MSRYIGQEPRRYNLTNQNFTATAGQTVFTLQYNPGSPYSILVHVNGVYSRPADAYGVVGKTLTFTYGLVVGDVVTVTYLGILNNTYPISNTDTSVRGSFSGLSASATGTNSNISINIGSICLKNAVNQYMTVNLQTLVLASAASGINGLDTGALSSNTWYYIHIISDGTNVATLASLSSTSPSLPGSYTFWARVGTFRTDGSANKYPLGFTQVGRKVQYLIAPGTNLPSSVILVSGIAGNVTTPTYVSSSVNSVVPSSALRIFGTLFVGQSVGAIVAPNANYGAFDSTSNPPPVVGNGASSASFNIPFDLVLESRNIFYAASASTAGVSILGWEDNL